MHRRTSPGSLDRTHAGCDPAVPAWVKAAVGPNIEPK